VFFLTIQVDQSRCPLQYEAFCVIRYHLPSGVHRKFQFIHLLPNFEGAIMASGKLVDMQKIGGKIKEFKKEIK